MAQSLDSTCEHTRDELLAAQCESRTLSPDSTSHLETCNACREAQKQLVGASPEALALLVLMRGIAPTPAPKKTFDIKPDEKFEEFLRSRTANPEVILLARDSYYGGQLFKMLYPEDANRPPPLADEMDAERGHERFMRPLYRTEDVRLSEDLVREFIAAPSNWEKMKNYRQLARATRKSPFQKT